MARPQKTGLEYYPNNCQQDIGLDLVEAEYGIVGYAVANKLYARIYGLKGYYCDWNDEAAMLFSRQVGLNNEQVTAVVDALMKRGIFDAEMYEQYSILTSRYIQEIYFDAVKRRAYVSVHDDYLLVAFGKNFVSDTQTPVIDAQTPVSATETPVSVNKSTQRRVEKRREKKIRAEQRESREENAAARHTPTLAEIVAYAKKENYTHVNCEKFFAYYDKDDWQKAPNWQGQLKYWEAGDAQKQSPKSVSQLVDPFEYDMDELERILSGEYDDLC